MIRGILDLQPQIFVHNDVLGESFKTEIGSVSCELFFPNSNPDTIASKITKLVRPSIEECPNISFWGQQDYPVQGFSLIANIAIAVENGGVDKAKEVYSNISDWWTRFYVAVVLLTKQGSYNRTSSSGDLNLARLQLFEYDRPKSESYIHPQDSKIRFRVTIPSNTSIELSCLNKSRLEQILHVVRANTVMEDSYSILFDAYRYKGFGDYKTAILYGATALEPKLLAELKRIDRTVSGQDPPPTLGEIFEKLENHDKCELRLTQNWRGKIVKVRNDVLHGRVQVPNIQATETFLTEVVKLLVQLLPTDDYSMLLDSTGLFN